MSEPRLKTHYKEVVVPKLAADLEIKNPMACLLYTSDAADE